MRVSLVFALLTSTLAIAVASADDFKTVDAVDLGIGSRKYDGKNVRVRDARCFYADVDDYRCTTGAMVSVFAKTIEPEASRKWIEDHCDSVKKGLTTSACRGSIKFTVENAEKDIVSGYVQRTVIRPEKIIIDLPEPKSEKRK